MTEPTTADFDGCHRTCRVKGAHSLIWGGCEHATPPEPTVSMSVVYDDTDGYKSIGFDSYTVPELGELITAGLRASDLPVNGDDLVDVGLVAAHAIVHRNAPAVSSAGVVQLPPTNQATPSRRAGLRDEIAAAIWERQNPGRRYADCEHPWGADAEADADAVLPVLYREWPWLRAEADEDEELTAQEARDLADELGTELYRAQDALAFVEECCVIADREQQPVTTTDVREWLKGARCGRQLVADGRAPELPPLDQDPVARRLGLLPAPVDRSAVLQEAASFYERLLADMGAATECDPRYWRAIQRVAVELRRMAAEAPATEERSGCPLCGHLGCMGKGRRCNVTMTSEARVWGPPCQCLGADAAVVQHQPDEMPDRIVGYRSPGGHHLYCTLHAYELASYWPAVTSEDLPDGGVCARCGVDVLIPQEPQS